MDTVEARQVKQEWRADSAWRTLSLIPFAEALLLWLFAKSYFSGMFTNSPDVLGVPLVLIVNVVILGWAALGARVVWTTKSPVMASIALATTTAPAIVLQLISPALVLIIANLG